MVFDAQSRNVILVLMAMSGMASAQPIIKTGACPEFTRKDAPENWKDFKIQPNGFKSGSIQNPLTAQQSINCIQVPPGAGLRAELWASEATPVAAPAMAYLQHFDFDERGRMWAVEPRAYPNIIRPAGATASITDQKFQGGTDRILILEDTDGDKVADKVTVFKDGLNLPQGILVVNGGVIITMNPYVVFFPSVNDVAGTPKILFSGMGPKGNFDTHGTISSLMHGLDNWIYGHTGYNDECMVEGVNCQDGKVWRFRHPDIGMGHAEKKFEIWSTGKFNAWGIGQNEDGQIFQSGATGSSHISHSIRKGTEAVDVRYPAPGNLFYPITGDRYLAEGSTAKNAQGQFTSGTTAVSGLQFYTSRLLPQKFWRYSFACEGANKLCNQDRMEIPTVNGTTGSTWRSVRMPGPDSSNIIASTDAWVAPILAKTGPDGAVWVLDWYNYLFLHNALGPTGPGVAWENQLRVKERIRIYRVTPADGKTDAILNLTNASVAELVQALGNTNMHWRLAAQRLLIKKGYSAELGTLLETILTTDKGVDDVGNNPRVLHALWTLEGLGQFTAEAAKWNPILSDLLKHPAWGVRRNVPRVMPATTASAEALNTQCAVNDTHGHVRLQVLVALAGISSKPTGMKAMWDTYKNVDGTNGHAASAFTPAGITSAATKPCDPVLYPAVPYNPTTKVGDRPVSQPRSDLRFSLTGTGFHLLAHGQLPSGELTVSDPQGRVVFRSSYAAGAQRWTRPQAEGLAKGIHLYAFRGVDGTRIQGRLGLTQP